MTRFRALPALIAAATAPLAAAQAPPTTALPESPVGQTEKADDDEADSKPLVFEPMSFTDAVSRGERLEKILVIVWHEKDGYPGAKWVEELFADEGVREWVRENGVPVRIDVDEHPKDARRNALPTHDIPIVDVFDVQRGGRLERLIRGATAIEFLASVFGSTEEAGEKPDIATETEPFRWLAWANRRFREVDPASGPDAVLGYAWCLHRADEFRPGFRTRYIEFLLKRVAECKQRATDAFSVLTEERNKLMRKCRDGSATRRDVYELMRVDFWLRKPVWTRDFFVELKGRGVKQREYRKWMFTEVVGTLGRYEQYDDILMVVEHDPVGFFQRRAAELQLLSSAGASEDDGEGESKEELIPAPETFDPPLLQPLEFAVPDTRADLIHDASWVFEALLASGRGKDAVDLREWIFATYPVNRSFGLFFERALRLELYGVAAEIADLGIATLDERGRRRMQRLLEKLAKETADKESEGGR